MLQDPSDTRLMRYIRKLVLDDKEPDVVYFWAGTCPVFRYRFKNNHLIAVGTVRAEAGVWHYGETDLTRPSSQWVRTDRSIKFFRINPTFDERGNLVGVTRTEEPRSPLMYFCAGEMVFSDRFTGLPDPEVPGIEPGMTREQVRRTFEVLLREPSGRRIESLHRRLVLDDRQPDVLYFSSRECPILRYQFQNNRLSAVGALKMKAGVWYFSEKDYQQNKWFRVDLKFDERGHIIGVARTEENPTQ